MQERLDPKFILANNAGARASRRDKRTGMTITLYDGIDALMDTDDGRWQTVCENHGSIACHTSQKRARGWMSQPEDWCEECRALLESRDVAT